MNEFGMKILRIKNDELKNVDVVLARIEQLILCSGPSIEVERGDPD